MNKIFLLLVLYQIKHFVADYPLQGKYMLGKFKGGTEWILPLLAHVSVHGAFTALICAAFKPELAIPLTLFDMVIHFVMDRIKASPNMLGRFKNFSANEYSFINAGYKIPKVQNVVPRKGTLGDIYLKLYDSKGVANLKDVFKSNVYFWWSLGLDQGVHHLTHYVIIWKLVS